MQDFNNRFINYYIILYKKLHIFTIYTTWHCPALKQVCLTTLSHHIEIVSPTGQHNFITLLKDNNYIQGGKQLSLIYIIRKFFKYAYIM